MAGGAAAGADRAPLVDGHLDVQVDARLGAVEASVVAVVVVVQVVVDLRLQRQRGVGFGLGLGQFGLGLGAQGQGHQYGWQPITTA